MSDLQDGDEKATPPAATCKQDVPAKQSDWAVAGPSHQVVEASPRSDEALIEPPGVSTGARRRDPQPANSTSRSSSSHGRNQKHHTCRRNHIFFQNRNREISFVPSNLTGLIIGKKGATITELENAADVVIKVGISDGINTDLTIYGTGDAILTAQVMIKDLIMNTANTSAEYHDLVAASHGYGMQSEACGSNQQKIDCRALCEQYKKYKEEEFAKLPPIAKDFYFEDLVVAAMTAEVATEWRKENYEMQVRRNSHNADSLRPIPNPVLTFEQVFECYPHILSEIYGHGFTRPHPIQSQIWPILLRGEDLICIAPTGTGKTLAVLISALIHLQGQRTPKAEPREPTILIVAGNRQVVFYLQKELAKFAYDGLRSVSIYKEGDMNAQVKLLSKGADVVIATPTRLNELAMGSYINLLNFSFVALIEVDSMIELGYDAQIRRSLCNMRPDKQMIMTCAEWVIGVRLFALSFMSDPMQVKLGAIEEFSLVEQKILCIEENQKENTVMQFLIDMNPNDKVIIFCGTRDTASNIAFELTLRDISCRFIYGDISPSEREMALHDVTHGNVNILVVTELACRDVNIYDLTHVINLDYPGQIEEYIDRLDRTGRAGRTGTALTCVTRNDWAHARDLILILEETKQKVPEELQEMGRRFDAMSIIGRGALGTSGTGEPGCFSGPQLPE